MRDQGIWSISLGTWGGVHVRLHGLFLLFAAFTAYLTWLIQHRLAAGGNAPASAPDPSLVWLAGTSLVILWVSVLAHELGHLLTAYRLGGGTDQIELGPWGGLSPILVPSDPRAELAVSIAGPLVNLLVAGALCLPILVMNGLSVLDLLHPLAPDGLLARAVPDVSRVEWLFVVKLTFWINWVLVLVNLIPVFPFDGGNIVQAALLWFLPDLNRPSAGLIVARFAKLVAVLLLLSAFLVRNQELAGPVPAWLALVLLAGLVFFSARQSEARIAMEEEEPTPLGYDFSDGYTSLERSFVDDSTDPGPEQGPVERWMQKRKTVQLKRQQEIEAEDDRRVDEVLARLHEVGLARLPDADRDLLNRVSERYRLRQNRPT